MKLRQIELEKKVGNKEIKNKEIKGGREKARKPRQIEKK